MKQSEIKHKLKARTDASRAKGRDIACDQLHFDPGCSHAFARCCAVAKPKSPK